MSASILWRPLKSNTSLGVLAPSAFIDAMTTAFGSRPWRLNDGHIDKLEAMAAVFGKSPEDNPYSKLVDLLEKHEEIEVWAEY